jgi:ATP synthase protein I
LQQITPKKAFRLVLWQFVVTLFLTAALWLYEVITTVEPTLVLTVSGLVGGMIAAITGAWFAYRVFAVDVTGAQPERIVRSFYWGEINKLLLTGALFITAFVLIRPIDGAVLIAVYFIVTMTPFAVSMCD